VLDGASTVPTAYDQAVSLMIQNVRIATCRKRQSYDFLWLRQGYMMQFQEIKPTVLREVSQRTLDLRVALADGRLQVLGHLQVFFEQEPMMGIFPLRAGHSNLWVRFPRPVTSRAILSHKGREEGSPGCCFPPLSNSVALQNSQPKMRRRARIAIEIAAPFLGLSRRHSCLRETPHAKRCG